MTRDPAAVARMAGGQAGPCTAVAGASPPTLAWAQEQCRFARAPVPPPQRRLCPARFRPAAARVGGAPHHRRRRAVPQGETAKAVARARLQAGRGTALGGTAGSRLLQHLAMPASADTALRLVRRLPLPGPETPRVAGVDGWAVRKRRTYGTVVVDGERRRVPDLLADRTAGTSAERLRGRLGIEAAARGRSTERARGVAPGAPKAAQAAGPCWPTCAKRSSAGCTASRPGSGVCRCRHAVEGVTPAPARHAPARRVPGRRVPGRHRRGHGRPCRAGRAGRGCCRAGAPRHGAAARAALPQPWSSGQAEGQANQLKP